MKQLTYSPVVDLPTPKEAQALAEFWKVKPEEAMARLLAEREKTIHLQSFDFLRHGYRPPIWEVCEALLDVPWIDKDLAAKYRNLLGFAEPIRVLLVLGGNRASKTQLMMYMAMRTLYEKPGSRVWVFHSTAQQSVEYHHSLMWQFLPPEHRRNFKSQIEYISWNQKQGFSFNKFVVQNASECSFRFYTQKKEDAVEGGEPDAVFADELLPADWQQTLEYRLTTRNGYEVVGFTPVEGYTPTVDWFAAGAEPVMKIPAFLMPKDGGPPLEHAALGVTEEEFALLQEAARKQKLPPNGVPWCRPQNCRAWLDGKTGMMEIPQGREFEMAPRVLRCKDPQKAIVHFVSSDNPFGKPLEVINKSRLKTNEEKRMRFYGIAEKRVGVRFPMFRREIHVVPAEKIPKEGTNYQVVDPCSGRSFFWLYIRATPTGHYVFREWPGNYYIPGVGVPEPWAEPSGDAKRLDGRPGKGQRSPGWGLLGYKKEIARLEGWREYEEFVGRPETGNLKPESGERKRTDSRPETGNLKPESGGSSDRRFQSSDSDAIARWNQFGPAKLKVFERFLDARFGNTGGFDEDGMVSLFEKFDEIGLTFNETSTGGGKWTVEDGCMLIESALAFDSEKPLDYFNMPKLFISEECVNLIFALMIYTGADGEKGAVKDCIDCLRYYFLKNCVYVGEQAPGSASGRGCY